MIRFLGFCIILAVLYFCAILLEQFDAHILVAVGDYSVDTSIIAVILSSIVVLCSILIILKIIFWVVYVPYRMRKRFEQKKCQRNIDWLAQAVSYVLVGNKNQASSIINKTIKYVQPEYQTIYDIIHAETEQNFEIQVQYLQRLTQVKKCSYFAFKRLAQIFHDHQLYARSESYAVIAHNMISNDTQILEILIDCYANLSAWNKLVIFVSKLSRVDPKLFKNIADKIARYYFSAAKDSLENGKDIEAINYLESTLELQPTKVEALDLYSTLNMSQYRNSDAHLKIIKDAFSAKPSFAIAELYIKFADLPAQTIYDQLSSQIDHKVHRVLLLTVASYLGLVLPVQLLKTHLRDNV